MKNQQIILASQSPRRKELLTLLTSDFDIQVANIDEKTIEKQILSKKTRDAFLHKAMKLVETLAKEKAMAIFSSPPDALVIGADTVVVHEGKILGKPADEQEAYMMLRSYAGKTHQVITGVAVQTVTQQEVFSVITDVTFWDWNSQMEEQMTQYIATGSPMDKAGAYGIQEMPSLWIKKIEGDYPNVVGLPVSYLSQVLAKFQ